jgi:hypothetical protein
VTWDDHQLGQRLTLAGLTLTTGPIVPGAPVELRLAGELKEPDAGLLARLTAEGTLAADGGLRRLALAPFTLHLADIETAGGLIGKLDLAARRRGPGRAALPCRRPGASGGASGEAVRRADRRRATARAELDLEARP